ncbi:lipopolysaccharide biosynthesis protein [Candidatus Caldatribacterium sp. SIUC1]|uniref:lipopolysaccharide biosynthesis protein n=1 Tax=Candidatus Caldatribacterium sp. SIUC1 TaxID=3418365 RepID=UPI003F69453C
MLVRHSLFYFLVRVVSGIINFLAILIYTRLISPVDYGQYALVVAGVGLFNTVCFQWLRLSLLRFFPQYLENPQKLLSTTFSGFLGLCFVTGVVGAILAFTRSDPLWRNLILTGIVLLLAEAWLELNLELQRVKLQPLRYGLMLGIKSATALGLGTALVIHGLGPYGPLSGLIVGCILATLFVGRGEWHTIKLAVDRNLLKELLKYGLPLTATFALNFIVSSSDRFIIAWLLGESAAGQYAAIYDLAQQPLGLLMVTVNLASYPLAIRALENKGKEEADKILVRNAIFLMGIGLPASLGMVILAPNISETLLGVKFRTGAAPVLAWVAGSIFLSGLRAYHFDLAFQLGRRTVEQIWVVGSAAVLNLILNLWWISIWGIIGAAYATFAAYFLALILSILLGRRVFQIPVPRLDWLKITLACIPMALVLGMVREFQGLRSLVIQVICGLVIYSFTVMLMNIGNIRVKILRGR